MNMAPPLPSRDKTVAITKWQPSHQPQRQVSPRKRCHSTPLTPHQAALARLRSFAPPPTNYHSLPLSRRAAVLILLFADRKGDLRVVLTIRSAKLKNYAGQAALPGGKADSLQETPWETARREACEEIGLPLEDAKLPPGYSVEHLAELPSNLAMTELGVRPCVAWLKHRMQEMDEGSARANTGASTTGTGAEDGNERLPDPARDLLPQMDAKEVAAMFTAPFRNFLFVQDVDEKDRAVEGQWYKGSWHSWHEEAWRMHQFYVPTVKKGSVFRSANTENTGLDASTAPCSPKSAKPVLLADERKNGQTKVSESTDKARATLKPPLPAETYKSGADALAQPRYRVFGMTARILVDAARVAYGKEPEFEHNSHFGDEDMIKRLMRIGRLSAEKRKGEVLTRDVMMKAKREGGAKLS